jgi:hypothetical protein
MDAISCKVSVWYNVCSYEKFQRSRNLFKIANIYFTAQDAIELAFSINFFLQRLHV